MQDANFIAITMGDPSGIGPEITACVAADNTLPVRPIVIGDIGLMRQKVASLGLQVTVTAIEKPEEAASWQDDTIQVLQVGQPLENVPIGAVSAQSGQAAFDYICTAIELARQGRVAAIVTAPIHKEALSAAGIKYPGHTEMLADLGGADNVAMMLANRDLRVVLVTIHCALSAAIERITQENVLNAIRFAHDGTRQFGIAHPRIAVAGLNPHAGEGGLFGHEETKFIAPAIAEARAAGMDVSGPWPGDTVFMQARQGRFDVVVAQYHDQGLIPVKYLGLEEGVNITLGLPFIRTSPDHGTAFDIAGRGIADPASLRTALVQAHLLVTARRKASAA
ncbi:MAG: 4-hydroxythreonine-4-phosphate dehydrogenase PdxA [Pseudomonadota bacterium]